MACGRPALGEWRARASERRDSACRSASEHRALLATRDELRGRLDAYHAKAAHLGRLEDPHIADVYGQAHAALFTAPTDLSVAADLVSRYQERNWRELHCLAGCIGTVVDGYCDDCGLAPPGRSATSVNGAEVPVASAIQRSRAARTLSTIATRRSRLGAGLVDIPPVPDGDPASAVMTDPTVAEHRRFCGRCDEPVGRTRNGRQGLTEGYCPSCGPRSRSSPSSRRATLVAGQYEVIGCLAHGGLGWIYLAKDHNVSDRWVVLKGLLDSADEHAMAAALAERRFLAEVEHPNIVKIHNFVEHGDEGYIVMEYVNGISLRGDAGGATDRQRRPSRPAPRRAGDRLLRGDPAGARPPPRPGAGVL